MWRAFGNDWFIWQNRNTGRSLRWPKKSSKELLTHEGICMKSRDGPKFEQLLFLLFRLEILITCQNPDMAYLFLSENPEMALNSDNLCLELHFSWNFGPSHDFMHMPLSVNISFDDFLGNLRDPMVWYFIYCCSIHLEQGICPFPSHRCLAELDQRFWNHHFSNPILLSQPH